MSEKAEHNNEQEVTGKFAMIPNELLGMLNKNILTPAGTVEKIDGDDLTWWGFFFTFRYQNKPCYQTRKTISERFDCSEKTVTRRTARLEGLGLLTVKKRKGTSNIYTAASVEEFLAKKTNKKVTPKEESSGEETKRQPVTDALEISAPVAEQSGSVSPVAAGGDASLPAGDDAVTRQNVVTMPWIESPFYNARLVPDARRWAQSQGALTWQDEIKLVWELKGAPNLEPGEHMRPDDEPIPVPEPAKQQVNRETPEYIYDEDDSEIPF